jgi:hypothetical protein
MEPLGGLHYRHERERRPDWFVGAERVDAWPYGNGNAGQLGIGQSLSRSPTRRCAVLKTTGSLADQRKAAWPFYYGIYQDMVREF